MTTDAESLKVKKDFVWNILLYAFAAFLLFVGWNISGRLIHDGQPLTDSLKILTTILAVPCFLLIAAFNRISAETIGVIIGAIIGFGLGKIG